MLKDGSERIIGVHSPLEAKLIENLGGKAIWASGYSISTSCFGLPDLDLLKPSDKLRILEQIIKATRLECIVDIDSGIENEFEFADFLSQLSQVAPNVICIEDEQTPKVSALYESSRPLLETQLFLDKLDFVSKHTNSKIWARTNAIVRKYNFDEIFERVNCISQHPSVSAIVLHGSDKELIKDITSSFPKTDFYLVTSLIEVEVDNWFGDLGVKGLIFGHDLLFASVIRSANIGKSILQKGTCSVNRNQAKRLINTLVDLKEAGTTIEEEMIQYYSARATEYDEWYTRKNQYDKGEKLNSKWHSDLKELEKMLLSFENENVIEFASGTGKWTSVLSKKNKIQPTDASLEMVNQCEKNTGLQTDVLNVFDDLPHKYRNNFSVFFCSFWISHVPKKQIHEFMEKAISTLNTENGKFVLVDSYYNPSELNCLSHKNDVQLRTLNSGDTYQIYKHYFTPSELNELAENYFSHWELKFTENYFFVLIGYL